MIKKVKKRILESSAVERIIDFANRVKINKKEDITLYEASRFIYKEFTDNSLAAESKAIAFNFTLAVFPGIIFVFTLIPYLEEFGISSEDVMSFLQQYIPYDLFQGLEGALADMVYNKNTGLLSFGFLLALFMSTNGMMGLIDSFNRCYNTKEKRNFFTTRLIALFLTVVMLFVLLFAMVFVVFGGVIISAIEEYFGFIGIIEWAAVLRFVAYFLIYFLGISIIYYLAPSVHKRWRFISGGSILASILSMLVSMIFSYYISNFASYNEVYGSIGTLIAFMIWVQWMATILLVGFEFNAGLDRARSENQKKI